MSSQAKLDFLRERVREAKGKVRTGFICAIAGLAFIAVGVIINLFGNYLPPWLNIAIIFIVLGGFLIVIGLPLLLVSVSNLRNLKSEFDNVSREKSAGV